MDALATITSKRQITIPVSIFKSLGLQEGEKVLVSKKKGVIEIKSMLQLVNELSGSVKIPSHMRGKDLDKVIEQAKEEYFTKKYKTRKL